jgi:hypothetical protein
MRLKRGKQYMHGESVSSSLSKSCWVRYAEATARIEEGALGLNVKLASIRGLLAADKIAPGGVGVSLSGTPLLADVSQPPYFTFATAVSNTRDPRPPARGKTTQSSLAASASR